MSNNQTTLAKWFHKNGYEPIAPLDFYRAIVEQGREWLKDGGQLFFEIGYDQGEDLKVLLTEFGYTEIEENAQGNLSFFVFKA